MGELGEDLGGEEGGSYLGLPKVDVDEGFFGEWAEALRGMEGWVGIWMRFSSTINMQYSILYYTVYFIDTQSRGM